MTHINIANIMLIRQHIYFQIVKLLAAFKWFV